MSEKQIFVVLSTCLATGLGSFGVGDSFPCKSKDEAQRMVDAGQAKHPVTEHVSKEEFNALQLVNNKLTTELAAANEKLSLPGELPEDIKKKISELEKSLSDANEKLTAPTTLPVEVEKQISELTQSLSLANKEKTEMEKNLETTSKALVAANKKLKAK